MTFKRYCEAFNNALPVDFNESDFGSSERQAFGIQPEAALRKTNIETPYQFICFIESEKRPKKMIIPAQNTASKLRQLIGYLAVLGSAFCFYLATVIIRWSKVYISIEPSFFVFVRFLIGFIMICVIMVFKKQPPSAHRYHLLLGRTLANCIAVYCFYQAVDLTSLASANILNMTYPLFIALFTWLFFKEQRDMVTIWVVGIAFTGIGLILEPWSIGLNLYDFWGLASGVSASFAIIYLNVSRQYHDSETILFYMFGIGTLIIYILFHRQIHFSSLSEAYYLLLCSLFGIGGQYLLTYGFRYITAVEGGIISSTRILLAALLGPIIASDPALSLTGWTGAFLIFGANVYLAIRKVSY